MARRTRALLLDVQASIEIAPEVARLVAVELGYDVQWMKEQLDTHTKLAKEYLLK